MPRPPIDHDPVFYTGDLEWLEYIEIRRAESPEALLVRLEEMLDNNELTIDEAIDYLNSL